MNSKSFNNLSVTARVTLAVLVTLFVSLACSAFFLTTFVKNKMTSVYIGSVETLFDSLQNGVEDSLERGQMKNFEKLLIRQKNIQGVVDVALYDRDGKINLSSSGNSSSEVTIDPQVQKQINSKKGMVRIVSEETINIYAPQMVKADCIRCHPAWKTGEHGGVLSLTYDLSRLNAILTNLQLILTVGSFLLLLLISFIIYRAMRQVVSKPVDAIIEEPDRKLGDDCRRGPESRIGQSIPGRKCHPAGGLTGRNQRFAGRNCLHDRQQCRKRWLGRRPDA